jgi:hypothetical protein
VVRAASRPTKKRLPIARVDVYVNKRPLRSINAHRGVVKATQVTIGREVNRDAIVEAKAWDGDERLAAYCKTRIR